MNNKKELELENDELDPTQELDSQRGLSRDGLANIRERLQVLDISELFDNDDTAADQNQAENTPNNLPPKPQH